jgi:hypothetical protein
MSSEHVESTNTNLDHESLIKSDIINSKKPHRVDINDLMFKIRENETKTKKENLFLLILICSVILSIGLVLSF